MFGFERRLCISFIEVTEIKLYRSTSIWISMIDGEDFVFKSLSNREAVLSIMQVLLCQAMRHESNTSQVEMDPALISSDNLLGDQSLPTQPINSRVRAQSCPSDIHPDINFQVNDPIHQTSTGASWRKPSNGEVSHATSTTSTECLMDGWTKEKQIQESRYQENAVDAMQLNCSLSDFFDMFLADDAPHSMQKYQERTIRDTEVNVTPWILDDDENMARTISFCHPIANSFGIGPSSTMAVKKQSLQRFGEFGLCLATTTNVSGFPGSDAFHVTDRWLVEQISKNGEVSFSVFHETVFNKRTMFKRVIETSTKTEIQVWYKGYLAMVIDALDCRRTASPIPTVQNFVDVPMSKTQHSVGLLSAVAVLLVTLLITQNFILYSQFLKLQVDFKSVQDRQTILLQRVLEEVSRSCLPGFESSRATQNVL